MLFVVVLCCDLVVSFYYSDLVSIYFSFCRVVISFYFVNNLYFLLCFCAIDDFCKLFKPKSSKLITSGQITKTTTGICLP